LEIFGELTLTVINFIMLFLPLKELYRHNGNFIFFTSVNGSQMPIIDIKMMISKSVAAAPFFRCFYL